MSDETFRLNEGNYYEHVEHGQVEILNLYETCRSILVTRNDDLTTTAIDPDFELQVKYMYTDDGGIDQIDQERLEDFQFKLLEVGNEH